MLPFVVSFLACSAPSESSISLGFLVEAIPSMVIQNLKVYHLQYYNHLQKQLDPK
jgi:hypothetical protein